MQLLRFIPVTLSLWAKNAPQFFTLLSASPLKPRALGHGLVGLRLNSALLVLFV